VRGLGLRPVTIRSCQLRGISSVLMLRSAKLDRDEGRNSPGDVAPHAQATFRDIVIWDYYMSSSHSMIT